MNPRPYSGAPQDKRARSVNPPFAVGAFYCVLDQLVVTTVARARQTRSSAQSSLAFTPAR